MNQLSTIALREDELIPVLQSSLYPGASPESIKLVIGYCKASGLDPMQKPVHIVPMWDSKAQQMRDVVMPGINLYRTQAARSGLFAGMTEAQFGPDITATIGGQEITYPEWCRVTAKRLMPSGSIAEFTAREFWIENYAVKGGKEKSVAANAMWTKRPRGQIAKCAAAQALRMAFPELASAPTAEEMDGKTIDMGAAEEIATPKSPALPEYSAADFAKNLPAWFKIVESGKRTPEELLAVLSTKATFTDAQKQSILRLNEEPVVADDAPKLADPFVAEMEKAEQQGSF